MIYHQMPPQHHPLYQPAMAMHGAPPLMARIFASPDDMKHVNVSLLRDSLHPLFCGFKLVKDRVDHRHTKSFLRDMMQLQKKNLTSAHSSSQGQLLPKLDGCAVVKYHPHGGWFCKGTHAVGKANRTMTVMSSSIEEATIKLALA